MNQKKYINLSVEELIHNQEFVETVKNIQYEKEWVKFLEQNRESKEEIIQARNIISLFNFEEGELNSQKKYELWQRISEFNKKHTKPTKTLRLSTFIKIAASVLIIISIGSVLYLSLNKNNQYNFAETEGAINSKNTVLILADGNKVEVEKEESQITVLGNQDALQINNDTVYSGNLSDTQSKKELQWNELIIPFGKKTMLVLNDGTKVWLNAGSSFAFPQKFRGKKRRVFLDGEAYFEVAENNIQPFIVSAANTNIEVLGTKFIISSYSTDDFSETVLLEGSVNIWGANKLVREKIQMSPNQKVTYHINEKQMVLEQEPDAEEYISWIEGWYEFSNENLELVLKKVERFYNVTFEYNQNDIKNALPITGKLDLKESIEEVMYVLSLVAEIEYQREGNNIKID